MSGNPHPLAKKIMLGVFFALAGVFIVSIFVQLSLVDDGIDILSKSIESCFSTVKDWKVEVLAFLVAEFFLCAYIESKWFGGPSVRDVIFVARLSAVPKLKAEVIFEPGDSEVFQFASEIYSALGEARGNMSGAGWNMMPLRTIENRDALPGIITNASLPIKAGASHTGIGFVVKKPIDFNTWMLNMSKTNTDNPVSALENAFRDAGDHNIGTVLPNTNLEADVRIVIGRVPQH